MNINDFLHIANQATADDLMQVANHITQGLDVVRIDLLAVSESTWACFKSVAAG